MNHSATGSAIPVIGQMVAGKRALKVAKEAGQEMITVYRGVRNVDDVETMVKKGKIVGKFTERFQGEAALGAKEVGKEGRKIIDSVIGPIGPIVTSVPKNINVDYLIFTTWKYNCSKKNLSPKEAKAFLRIVRERYGTDEME